MRKSRPVIERFMEKTFIIDFQSCVEWKGRLENGGYGVLDIDKGGKEKPFRAHRWIYEQCFGLIPSGMTVDHVCHNESDCLGGKFCPHRKCVNPFHLALKTLGDNSRSSPNFIGNRTACFRGHPYAEGNFRITNGSRVCLLCEEIRQGARKGKPVIHRKTSCIHGHPYTEENTYIDPRGRRFCRICQRAAKKSLRERELQSV